MKTVNQTVKKKITTKPRNVKRPNYLRNKSSCRKREARRWQENDPVENGLLDF